MNSITSDNNTTETDKNNWNFGSLFQKYGKEKINRLSKIIPNMMAEIPEQEKLIILIDIVGFSKSSTREQVYLIYMFQQYLTTQIIANKMTFKSKIHINQFIPTGDGCYIVADKCAASLALEFLVTLISSFRNVRDDGSYSLSLRVSALFGSCVPFMDMAKHRNFVGVGMNEAARILSGGQSVLEKHYMTSHTEADINEAKHFSRNCLFVGDSLAEAVHEYEDKCSAVYTFRDVADKHGMTRNITVMQGIL